MQIRLQKVSDTLTPDLRRLYKAVQNKAGLHKAMGLGLVSLAKRAFNDSSLRPSAWPAKKDGTAARLRDTGTLAKNIRVITANERGVKIGTDRKYAAIHQLGGRTRPHIIKPKNGKALAWPGGSHPVAYVKHPGSDIPARPFLPFDKSGQPTAAAVRLVREVVRRRLVKKS